MSGRVLFDNDVALKISCYALISETLRATTLDGIAPAMLGVGRFVIRTRLSRAKNIADRERARASFEHLLKSVSMVEPNEAELSTAADLEAEANRRDLELDGGESQLLAILANRGCNLLLTGDKRAIVAMSVVAIAEAASRVACLEQLIAHLLVIEGTGIVRPRVCAEEQADLAITLCFGCSMTVPPQDGDVLEGLASYTRHLGLSAPGVLLPGTDLTAIAA